MYFSSGSHTPVMTVPAQTTSPLASNMEKLMVFKLHHEDFALPIKSVRGIKGFINPIIYLEEKETVDFTKNGLKKYIPLTNLYNIMKKPPPSPGTKGTILILSTINKSENVGFLVGETAEIIETTKQPLFTKTPMKPYLEMKLNHKQLLILNPSWLLVQSNN